MKLQEILLDRQKECEAYRKQYMIVEQAIRGTSFCGEI